MKRKNDLCLAELASVNQVDQLTHQVDDVTTDDYALLSAVWSKIRAQYWAHILVW